jgi:hypothetical protein
VAGTDFDQLFVADTATIEPGATLDLTYLNGFSAAPGDEFVMLSALSLTGVFDTVNLPDGQVWRIEYSPTTVTATVVDCPGNPGHVSTAQELIDAIDCANADPDTNTIYLEADITLTAVNHVDEGANGLPTLTTPIVVEGQNHVIERDPNAVDPFRLFHVRAGGDLTLNEVTLRNGHVDPTTGSGERNGGAIRVKDGNATITRSVLSDNDGVAGGGAIMVWGSSATVTLDDVTLTGNIAINGGSGGALAAAFGATLIVRNSSIIGNQTTFFGGGIAVQHNTAQVTITNSIVSGNHGMRGGGIHNKGTLTMINCTLAGNRSVSQAQGEGGGLYNDVEGNATLVNSILWGNASATEGPQIDNDGTLAVTYTGIDNGLAGITGAGPVNDNGGNLTFSSGDSVFVNPVDPASSPTTEGDYHLAPDSVAINQGDNTEATNAGLTTDFEGDDRILGGTVDMGADEAIPCEGDGDDDGDGVCNAVDACEGFDDNADADSDGTPDACDACAAGAASGDTNADGSVDLDDFANLNACLSGPAGGLGLGCECFDFDSDGDNDLLDFAEFQVSFNNP